jgi:1-deoxyxylulose-5-phosphate synthase
VNRRKLGLSGIEVSEISLGSWLTYSGGVSREQARACVNTAFDEGVNFIDTANVYGRGAAETLLGEVLSGYERSSYVLATKLYFPMSDTDRGLSAKQVHKQIDASLERLQTDYVDLYQCHRYDEDTPLEETVQALGEVVVAGKARHIGFSEWPVERVRESLEIADSHGLPVGPRGPMVDSQGSGPALEHSLADPERPGSAPGSTGAARWVSSQPQYSMLWRAPEKELIPLCEAEGISQIVWSPLAQGVLTGKYKPGEPPPSSSRAANESMSGFMDLLVQDRVLEAVQRLGPVAEQAGLTMAQLALAWVLRQPNVASAIVGASRPEQVRENASASGVKLDTATLAAVDEALEGVAVR